MISAEGTQESVGTYTITKTDNGFTIDTGEGSPAITNVLNTYKFTVSGLPKSGTIDNETGEYTYFVTEETMIGYKTSYLNPSPSGDNPSQDYAINGGKIINTPEGGYELPQTGGIGTTLFTALGGLMTVTAGAILTMHRRKRKLAEG